MSIALGVGFSSFRLAASSSSLPILLDLEDAHTHDHRIRRPCVVAATPWGTALPYSQSAKIGYHTSAYETSGTASLLNRERRAQDIDLPRAGFSLREREAPLCTRGLFPRRCSAVAAFAVRNPASAHEFVTPPPPTAF